MKKTFIVWYMKPEHFREGIFGALPNTDITKSHVRVTEVVYEQKDGHGPLIAGLLEFVFTEMQAEKWSPHGEARRHIESLGLQHTSMSVGDIVQDGDDLYIVRNAGFANIRNLGWHGETPRPQAG